MKATNLKLCGMTTLSTATVSICDEYATCQSNERVRIPVLVMTAEPKCDRRYFRREAEF